jgi:hypothetical protein
MHPPNCAVVLPTASSVLLKGRRKTLRPGFAERVLRAARAAADMPSLASQFALSAVTAAACLAAVLFAHNHSVEQADARNLAEWRQIVAVASSDDTNGL